MRLIDADALKETIFEKTDGLEDLWDTAGILNTINNAPTIPLPDFKEGYKQAIIDGKTNYSSLKENLTMDEVNKKAIERMGDILDAIKVEIDTITEQSNSHDEDVKVSETILNLSEAFDKISRNIR